MHAASFASNRVESDLRERIARLEAQALVFQSSIDHIAIGICRFDVEERLIFRNRAYAEIYDLDPEDLPPGTTLRDVVERRVAAGTATQSGETFLKSGRRILAGATFRTWRSDFKNGRAVQVRHQPTPDGGWVSTHEDITEYRDPLIVASERISLQALIDGVRDNLWVKDAKSRFIVANKAVANQIGVAEPGDLLGKTDFEFHAPELAEAFYSREQEILLSGQPMIEVEECVIKPSGDKAWISTTKVPLRDERGEIFGLLGNSHDITERKLADSLRDGQSHILEMIAASAPLRDVLARITLLIESQTTGIFGSVLLLDEDGEHLRHGAAPSLPVAYSDAIDGIRVGPDVGSCGTAVHRREAVFVADIQTDPLWADFKDLAAEHGFRSCWSTPIRSYQGSVLGTFAMYSGSVREPTASEIHLIESATRIAGIAIERKQAEDRIYFMANHDSLTGLPNRMLLKDRISQALLDAKRYGRRVALVFIDLDNFKFINDSLGHNAGDELLKTVANRMVDCVRASDTVVRLGGDEFVVLLRDQPSDFEAITDTVKRLAAAIGWTIHVEGHDLTVSCSLGVASYPGDGADADALLANADAAMYRAKDNGRDEIQFYRPEMNTRVREKLALREELRGAITRSEFVLHYQPQIDLRTGEVFAVEALIRWNHPTQGLVSPLHFIAAAEETGLIVPIGDWVLREACRRNKAWQDAGLPPMTVCVNVSARQFREKNLVARVVGALAESGLDAKYLELEMTESVVMLNVEQAVETMKALRALGVRLSIDDFGTGYSSLSALTTFPVARLKIDRSFIRDLATSEIARIVASAIIALGQKLHLRVIAEGVETDEQMAFLLQSHCDEVQGYIFSKPLAAAPMTSWLLAKSTRQGEKAA